MTTRTKALCRSLLAVGAIALSAGWQGSSLSAQTEARTLWGTWYLAVDSTPFGIPDGILPALMTIHRDGTFNATDAGDLGSFPFTTTDTTQHGTWVRTGQTFRMASLFLRKDEITGDLEGWHRVSFTLQFGDDADHLVGWAEEQVLPCDPAGPTPFTLLNCPNPISSAFEPSPFPIPVELFRLRVHEAN